MLRGGSEAQTKDALPDASGWPGGSRPAGLSSGWLEPGESSLRRRLPGSEQCLNQEGLPIPSFLPRGEGLPRGQGRRPSASSQQPRCGPAPPPPPPQPHCSWSTGPQGGRGRLEPQGASGRCLNSRSRARANSVLGDQGRRSHCTGRGQKTFLEKKTSSRKEGTEIRVWRRDLPTVLTAAVSAVAEKRLSGGSSGARGGEKRQDRCPGEQCSALARKEVLQHA